ncbi:HD-GYP domain-containing protein [Peribacillus frigoritolerans]|uniref:HD-GYP domain-containing protein n=1 Tax=Peribacillus frigoritolerans TaxID=450367 RepID=UPI0023DCA820|nr:HD domain-containing phosphohydrolase [Peribacillus frigoritolerans]MDF2000957.1 HD domain-containing protein [Peribacillus frigoritolerans]
MRIVTKRQSWKSSRLLGGIDFEREIKAAMRIDRVFKVGGCRAIPYERKIIEMHPLMGSDILNKISREINNDLISSLEVAENIILHHHEKWDGTGYPHRLKGEEIPLEARIVAIVDVFDALTSRRPYKDSWSVERALSFINEQKGKYFRPIHRDVFLLLFDEKAAQKKGCDTVRSTGI